MSRAMVAAASKDAAARRMPEKRMMRKVGGMFKRCCNCQSTDVFRAENPDQAGWLHWCWTCGCYDEDCWLPLKEDREADLEHRETVMADLRVAAKLDKVRRLLM